MKIKTIFILFSVILSIFSCDILRFGRFEVESWSPDKDYYANPEDINISLNFSLEPDRGSVERNFSLTGNGNNVYGKFSWNGNKMTFAPLTPYEKNIDYIINLSPDAHDIKGLSMDEAFTCYFTTRPDKKRPVLLSCYPQMYDIIDDLRTEIALLFSIPVSLNALYGNVTFSPSMQGSWRLENDDTLAIFTPYELWQHHTRYEIRISSSMININGMEIGKEFLSVFTTNSDNEAPYLVSAQRITKNNEYIDLYRYLDFADTINENWEKDDRLFLSFSEPVDWITVKNNVSAVAETSQAAPSLSLESYTEKEFIFKFDSNPSFESRFIINIKTGIKDNAGNESKEEYVYKIFADGKNSKPPKLIGLRMPLAPGEPDLQLFYADINSNFKDFEISNIYYPSGENIPSWIELYFDAAADIDLFSIMELFRVDSSNLTINFSSRLVKNNNFTISDPHAGWENYQRIEIAGFLTNSVNFGIIYFQIGSGLSDSLGNKNEKPQTISVTK